MTGMENVPVTPDQGSMISLSLLTSTTAIGTILSDQCNAMTNAATSRVTVCHHHSGDRDAGPEMGH